MYCVFLLARIRCFRSENHDWLAGLYVYLVDKRLMEKNTCLTLCCSCPSPRELRPKLCWVSSQKQRLRKGRSKWRVQVVCLQVPRIGKGATPMLALALDFCRRTQDNRNMGHFTAHVRCGLEPKLMCIIHTNSRLNYQIYMSARKAREV